MRLALTDEKAVGGDAKRGVVMKAAPIATLVVVQSELLLEFLVLPSVSSAFR